MISLLISATAIVAVKAQKTGVKHLFNMPLDIENGGILAVVQRYKQKLLSEKLFDRRVSITLLENIVYKEFSHLPTTQKAVTGFAALEARTVLREQANNYLINHIDYGSYRNKNDEEISLLLAAPTAFLKAMQTAFVSCGFTIHGIHSSFDAYMAACQAVAVPLMGQKSFVAIDFGYENTMLNVYCYGLLASQRRLQGFSSALLEFVMADVGCNESEAVLKLRETKLSEPLHERVKEAILSFIWDTLRTVRVVTAPLSINLEEFFISGEMCENKVLRDLLSETLELPCTFANDVDCSALNCTKNKSSLFIHAGAGISKMDLLSEIRIAKKNTIFDVGVCAAITAIVVIGLLTQPFVVLLRNISLENAEAQKQSLALVSQALSRSMSASAKLNGIAKRKEALKECASNAGETLPQVAQLFVKEGLAVNNLTYDGATGTYNINFKANSKEMFLELKDKIYSNPEYFLNLNLSSYAVEDGSYFCILTFIPASHKELFKDEKQTETPQTKEEVNLVEDFANEKQ